MYVITQAMSNKDLYYYLCGNVFYIIMLEAEALGGARVEAGDTGLVKQGFVLLHMLKGVLHHHA